MGLIRILPPGLVNRIAAGECIERPASVVKELVENALDAGAARIDVTVEAGGRDLIRVADDGCGMDADDLRLCLTPHATSKIIQDDDLFNIHTMGFRGEALPSIASVSRVRVASCPPGAETGHTIEIDAGRIGEIVAAPSIPGTTVEVRDLFHCVPARRRFLRTNQTEMGHITEQLARIALAHPEIGFTLTHGKRTSHRLPAAADRRKRIADFYGPELAEVLLPISRDSGGVRVDGLVAPPAESRGSSKWEYLFVNGRYIRDRFVSHAVKEAYRSLIDPGSYPVAFLFITIDPGQIDVNVHPTKVEVRWKDSNFVHGQVLAALRDKFLQTNLDRPYRVPQSREDDVYRDRVRDAMVDFFTRSGSAVVSAERSAPTRQLAAREAMSPERETPTAASESSASDALDSTERPADPYQKPRPAIQIHNTYLVVETDQGVMIIDQHALHERVLYEQFRRRMTDRPLESQRLLIPETVRVAPDRIEALEAHADSLARLGIELRAAGPQSVALYAFPSLLERVNPAVFVRELLDLLSDAGARPEPDTLLHELLDMMACKAAVKAGDPLTPDEIESLLAARVDSQRSSNCPHGRPTTLHLTLRDLERQFKRR
ncbi:MAG: DNA mismatch repair endonuclease MutL [Planctomycetes bacterium]|nr:DNA mismatch repair endonuclease MutL [Planctomycetota bacterium]